MLARCSGSGAVSLRIKGHGAKVKLYRLKAHAKHLGIITQFPRTGPRSSPRRGLFCFLLQARLGQYDLPFVCPCGDGVGEILVNVGATATSPLPFAGATRNFVRVGRGMRPGMMRHGMHMRVIMILMDTDGDGALSLEEFQTAHAKIFKGIDADKDGKVTPTEMQRCSFVVALRLPSKTPEAQ